MTTKTWPALFLFAFGCTATSPWIEPPARAPRASLFFSDSLRGDPVTESNDGPWLARKTRGRAATSRTGGPGGPTTPGAGGPSTSHGGSYMGPTTGGAPPAGGGGRPPARYAGPGDSVPPAASGDDSRTAPRPKGGELKAGRIDDSEDLVAFANYIAEARGRGGARTKIAELDISDACSIRVRDRDGRPVPGATVNVVDTASDCVVWRGTTYGDGAVPIYPKLLPESHDDTTYLVEVGHSGKFTRTHWDGDGAVCEVRWPAAVTTDSALAIDVAFVIDTTGSMGDEIQRIKATLGTLTDRLQALDREADLRYAAVLYRDLGDAYVTRTHGFTTELDAFAEAIQGVEASGGGDGPESLNQGLAVAVDRLAWRSGVARLAFVIGDAPPHTDYEGDVQYTASVRAAVASGIKIHTVAASGLDPIGSAIFRQIAQFTRGEFVFIEYGGDAQASARAHGIATAGPTNNLDAILFEQIRREITGWGHR